MKQGIERIGRTVPLGRAKRSCLDKRSYSSRNKARDKAAKFKAQGWAEQARRTAARCAANGIWPP